ncbi:MAG: carboxypeptidase regulatory-like domain-containing protein [Natrialbaceae archaeon]|nr:carboxypeptidase regulatory-like domain-containing protein [Natrialbaceae archaeon]
MTGTVTDGSGTPLTNSTVDADGTSTTTDGSGAYTLDITPGSYNVTASQSGYVANTTTVSVGPGATETQNFSLVAQNGTISGTVLEPSGASVAGATVTIDGTGQSTTTAGDGTYTLTNVSPSTYNLTATLTDYDDGTATNVAVAPGASVTDVNLTVTPQVTDLSIALANSTVTVGNTTQATVTATWANGTSATATSAANLSSANTTVATVNGSGVVTANAAGQTNISTNLGNESDSAVLTVVEDAPAPLPATFYGDLTIDGSPGAAGTTIEAEINGTVRGSITTNTSGQYGGPLPSDDQLVVNGTSADENATIEFYVNGSGFNRTQAAETATWSAGDTTELNLTVSTIPGTLTGTVTDGSGTPISGATVQTGAGSDTTDGSGGYTITLAPGSYTVTAAATSYQNASAAVSIVSNTTTTQNFSLSPENGTITGTVTDESGTPLANATVDADGISTTSDGSGLYSLNVTPASYNVTASQPGYVSNTTTVSVSPGATETQNFSLAAQNGTISGTVLEPSGAAVAGATVTIDSSGQSTTTAGDGTYTLTGVSAGTYNLTASLTDYDDGTATGVTVAPGASVTDVNLTVTPQVTDLSIALANSTLTIGNTTQATVTATWANGTTANATSAATLSSGNTTVATVSGAGVVTANAAGQTNITATYGNESDAAVLTVVEDAPDPLPATFYGDLTIDGSPGPAGTTIEAEIGGTVRGSITTNMSGQYGGPLPSDDQLVVNGTAADANATIEFYVNGTGFNRTQAAETATWSAGDTTELNLTVSTTPGTLNGTVTDESGTPISGATVQAGTGSDTTDASGSCSIDARTGQLHGDGKRDELPACIGIGEYRLERDDDPELHAVTTERID